MKNETTMMQNLEHFKEEIAAFAESKGVEHNITEIPDYATFEIIFTDNDEINLTENVLFHDVVSKYDHTDIIARMEENWQFLIVEKGDVNE